MTEDIPVNNGCWNCIHGIHIKKDCQYVAVICRMKAEDWDDDVADMSGETCEHWERKYRDRLKCPFHQSEGPDGEDDICMFDGCECDPYGCHKGDDYSDERIKHHIALTKNYLDVLNYVNIAKDRGITFDEEMADCIKKIDEIRKRHSQYQKEMDDISKL